MVIPELCEVGGLFNGPRHSPSQTPKYEKSDDFTHLCYISTIHCECFNLLLWYFIVHL